MYFSLASFVAILKRGYIHFVYFKVCVVLLSRPQFRARAHKCVYISLYQRDKCGNAFQNKNIDFVALKTNFIADRGQLIESRAFQILLHIETNSSIC